MEPTLRYEPPASPFRVSYFEGWNVREEEGTVSLWRSPEGGAVTISSFLNRDPGHVADALEHVRRFAEKTGLDLPHISGGRDCAEAAFDVSDGGWCKARVVASGPRFVLATYHADREDSGEEAEADVIIASVAVVPGR